MIGIGNNILMKASAVGGGMWVAVGQGTNTIAYSIDGINWTVEVHLFLVRQVMALLGMVVYG